MPIKIFHFKCPIETERNFFTKLLRLSPEKAAAMMAKEFVSRFKPDCGLQYIIDNISGCRTWTDLGFKLRNFTVIRRPEPISDNQKRFWPKKAIAALEQMRNTRDKELDFWDNMRHLLPSLSTLKNQRIEAMAAWEAEIKGLAIDDILAGEKFKRFSSLKKQQVKSLHKQLSTAFFSYYLHLLGCTPSEAARAIAYIYSDRFGQYYKQDARLEHKTLKSLTPSHTWVTLDRKICLAAKNIDIRADIHDELDFWDSMRYILKAFPHHNDTKEYENRLGLIGNRSVTAKSSEKDWHDKNWQFAQCELCWRTIAIKTGNLKKKLLRCSQHEHLKSGDFLYRKIKRLQSQIDREADILEKQLRAEYPRSAAGNSAVILAKDLFYMTDEKSPLSNLKDYLKNGLEKKADLGSLMLDFYGPLPDTMEDGYKSAMEWYVKEQLQYPTLSVMLQIAKAEAWLSVVNSDLRRKK